MKKKEIKKQGHRLHFSISPFRISPKRGFTLLEMVISLGIFSVVIITAVGAILALGNAQAKAGNIQNIQDNLRFTLESMTKEMRTATTFVPGAALGSGYRTITFTRQDGVTVTYCILNNAIQKIMGVTCDITIASPVTDTSVVIDQMLFYVIGQQAGASDGQPRITISLLAHTASSKLATSFRIQTSVAQRLRDD